MSRVALPVAPRSIAPRLAPSSPSAPPRAAAARLAIAAGLSLALLAAAGLARGEEPFRTYFYAFLWWGWIAVAGGWTHLRGHDSLLLDRPASCAWLAAWSVPFWLVFEGFNLVLRNWYYVGAMPTAAERQFGMVLCFATVLPGVLVTRQWLASLGLFRRARCRPWPVGAHTARRMLAAGLLFTALPLLFPDTCYPLVWGATVLLGEAWLVARGRGGLRLSLAAGDPRPVLQLLAAGFVTGGLWESWNFRAGAKWIYTVPGFEQWKWFEMPVLGFLGFPPFALECWSCAWLLVALGLCPLFEGPADVAAAPRRRRWLAVPCAALVAVPLLWFTDRETVRGTRPLLAELVHLPAAERAALEGRGLREAAELRRELEAPVVPAELSGLGQPELRALRQELELVALAGLGSRGAAWLAAVGVTDRSALAALDWRTVEAMARGDSPAAAALRERHGPVPYPREVRVWIRAARAD
jgi:hypothetical protein